ncbi:MAG: SDR family oxidoreductase [Actinomycetota bacterium]
MKCLVTGAYGFIGSEVVAALLHEEVTVIGCGRDLELARRINPAIEWIACDFNTDVTPAHWLPRLAGIDAVVNCVGILQGNLRDDAERIHADATIALFEAASASGVRRIIHVSAVSAETDVPTAYAQSKAKADAALSRLDVNWLIVKPSLVIGRGAYGGTSLMRGLAGLPFVLPLPGEGSERFQPIALDDLARGIAQLATREEPARTVLHAAGPETLSLREILVGYRHWLGFGRAHVIVLPISLLRLLLRLGDLAGYAGYVTSARSTSLAQLRYDTLVDGSDFAAVAGGRIKGFEETLAAWPATLQDRLHARSFFAVPLLQIATALFWILSGVLTLTPSRFASATTLVAGAGFGASMAKAVVAVGSIADIVVGALFLLPKWVRRAGVAQLILSTIYLFGLSVVAPSLWADHFGPLLKVLPMMAATLVVMAFQEKR